MPHEMVEETEKRAGKPERHGLTRFVNRQAELAELRSHLEAAIAGRGRLVLVAGEAGVGKTRLVTELAESAGSSIRFLAGKCLYHEDADPYLPFIDALRPYLERRGRKDAVADESDESVGGLGMLAVPGGGPIDIEDSLSESVPLVLLPVQAETAATERAQVQPKINLQEERERIFETVSTLIANISTEMPVLLFIDDIQWADRTSLQLLHYLARNIRSARVLLACAYRPEDVEETSAGTHPLTEILQRLGQEKLAYTLRLSRLKPSDVEQMVKVLLDVTEIPPDFVAALYSESEGNPFFVEEVLKSLMDEGVLEPHKYVWTSVSALTKVRIPSTIKDVMERRISRLSEKCKKTLMAATVIGYSFSFEVLRKVSDLSEEDLLDCVDELIKARLIKEAPGTDEEVYKFDHAQVRAVVYEGLSKSRLRLMHRKVGEAVEETYGRRLDDYVFALSRYFTIGKEPKKATLYSVQAGDKALKKLALSEAAEYYRSALESLGEQEETAENVGTFLGLTLKLGNLLENLGEWDGSLEWFSKRLELAKRKGLKPNIGETLLRLGYLLRQRGHFDQARESYTGALALARELGDPQMEADSLRGLGWVHWRKGLNNEALAYYQQSLERSGAAHDEYSNAVTMIDIGNIHNNRGEFEAAIDHYGRAIAYFEGTGECRELARAHNNLGDIYLQTQDWDKAIDEFEKCKQTCDKIPNKDMSAWAIFNAAYAYAYKGMPEKSLEYSRRALAMCEELDDKVGMSGSHKNIGVAYRFLRQYDKATAAFEKAIQAASEVPYELAVVYVEYAKCLIDMGETAKARKAYEEALGHFEEVGARRDAESTKKALAELS